jgi:drug/metabolite transporter (DMT)-like permease
MVKVFGSSPVWRAKMLMLKRLQFGVFYYCYTFSMSRSSKIIVGILFSVVVIILPFLNVQWWHLLLPLITLFGIIMLITAIKKQKSKPTAKRSRKSKAALITLYTLAALLLLVAAFVFCAAYIVGPPVPN